MSAMDAIKWFDYILFTVCLMLTGINFLKKLKRWLDEREN